MFTQGGTHSNAIDIFWSAHFDLARACAGHERRRSNDVTRQLTRLFSSPL